MNHYDAAYTLDRVWLFLVMIGCFLLMFGLMGSRFTAITKQMDLSDQIAAERILDLEDRLMAYQQAMESRLLQHSVPIQLGSLTPDDVAKLNIQLATAIAANQGCYVTIECEAAEGE